MRMPTYKARYQVVRELRERERLTQEEAWEKAGIAQGTYQAMESGKAFEEGREFKESNLKAVADLFRVALPDIAHGAPEAQAARWLLTELDDLRKACKEADQRLQTPHLLLCLLRLDHSLLRTAIEQEVTTPVATLIAKLDRAMGRISSELRGYRDFNWNENRYFVRALQYAGMRNRDAHDGDLALAILQLGLSKPISNTVVWLHSRLGRENYSKVVSRLRELEPPDPTTPVFPDSTLS